MISSMEDHLIVSSDEHKVLKKFKTRLEKRHHVVINMPETVEFSESDIIFVSIVGEKLNVENVKKFLSMKMKAKSEKTESQKNVVLITLSDSEDSVSSDSESIENSVCVLEELACANNYPSLVKKSSVGGALDSSVCVIDCPENPSKTTTLQRVEEENGAKKSSKCNPLDNSLFIIDCSEMSPKNMTLQSVEEEENGVKKSSKCNPLDNSLYIIDCSEMSPKNVTLQNVNRGRKRKWKQERIRNKRARMKDILITIPNEAEVSEISSTVDVCEVSSTTEETVKKAQPAKEKLADFIPLGQKKEKTKLSADKCGKKGDVVLLEEPVSAPRPLRPVVIDGSNVAMEHGKVSHCFSAKGIQLAVEYFLKRGHTIVHAFVPKFRRISNPHHNFPTKDPEILDELAKKQLVIFTPSRRVNGKCIASYDDRFIVDLASRLGGVIVSNDNYRDLIGESDSFKESIEKRLLMFCFVGDIFMIPSDPLGRNGPSLEDFLSFPPESKT